MRGTSCNDVTQLLLGCFAETGQFSDTPGFACLLQLLDGTNLKLVVKSFDLPGAKPWQREQLENSGREFRAQFLQIFQRSRRRKFLDLKRDALSDSWNFRKRFFVLKVGNIPAECFDRTRSIRISPDFKRVFIL